MKLGNSIMLLFGLMLTFLLGIMCERIVLRPEVKVSYISQSELLELEKQRLQGENTGKKQLFLGYPKEAIEFIERSKKDKETRNNIVLISEKKIYGKKVHSISKEVHKEMIAYLGKR